MTITVSDHIVSILARWGVDTVFGLPGDGINGFVEACRKAKDSIRYIHCRHEEAAALAASGYAKFSGRLGVCFATAAPGAVHLLNGLYDAKIDGAPVLAITGMTYHDLIGTRYLQDINQDYLYQDVALYNQRLMGPTHVENVVELACRAALSNRGVAHVAIPIDMQVMAADEGHRFKRNVKGHTGSSYQPPRRLPEEPLLQEAARLLAGHSKVAILAGSGARGAHAELEQVAERLSAPVIKSLLGKDCLPDTSPYTTGGIGVVGTRPSFAALKECDAFLIIAVASLTSSSCRSPGRQCAGRSTTSRNTSACDTLPTLAWLATPDQRFADCFHTCHVTTTAHFYSRRRSE
jgi:pyruvate dehydrogenase (quinone)